MNVPALVFLHAHPDDECVLTGCTLSKASALELRTVVVFGTRGDAGETNADLGGEALGDRRVREAEAACHSLGVARVEWLDYADSGMADTETTQNPQAFCNADPSDVAKRLVALLADENIHAVIGYDNNGTYGHPDHFQVHHVAHAFARMIGAPWLLDATYNREQLAELPDSDGELDPAFAAAEADLTHFVTGDEWIEGKFAAISHHMSQTPDDFDEDNTEMLEGFKRRFAYEWFIATSPTGATDLGILSELLEPKPL